MFRSFISINKEREFIAEREKSNRQFLLALSLAGSFMLLILLFSDSLLFDHQVMDLLPLALSTMVAFGLNLFIAFQRNSPKAFRQHLIALFYLGTLFCGILATATGGYGSNYIHGLLFILMCWLVLIPFSFTSLAIHFVLFLLLFNGILGIIMNFAFSTNQIFHVNFQYIGVSIVGFFASLYNNKVAIENFQFKQSLQKTNAQLVNTNAELIKTQEIRKESEEKYRTLIERSMDGIVISQEGKVLLVNEAFARMLGYSTEEMYAGFGPDSIAPENRQRVMDIHFKRMRGEIDIARYSAAFLKKNGDRAILELNTTTIYIEGKPASLITLRDITEFVQIQNALKESESKYRMLIDRANDGIIITQFGKFRFANRAFCELMEYTEDEVLEKPFADYLVDEDKERLLEYHRKRMEGDKSQFIYECQAVTKSNRKVHLELNTTYIEYQGHPATFIIMRDLTDRKAIEHELEKSRKRYKNLIESIQEGLYVIQDQKFVFLNDAIVTLIGYSVDELKGKEFIQVIPPEHREIVSQRHQMRMRGEPVSTDFETTLLHKDGKTRVPVILSTTLTEFDDKPAVVGTAKDISERIMAEQEIRAAHKKLEEINHTLETTIEMRTTQLTEANTQLIKLQKENLQSQFEMLKQQVNPHFLFNSLNVLSSLIKLEPDLAEKFTDHLSKVYRYVLEYKDNELVKLSVELDFLAAYTFLLNIRFMGKLEIYIDIPLEKRDYLIIPLALQLLIENAIKHNAMSKKSPLKIRIFVDADAHLVVVNNLQERENFFPSTGVGLKNIAHRYILLNMKEPVFEKTNNEFVAKIPLLIHQ